MLGFVAWAILTLIWAPDMGSGTEKIAQYVSRTALFLLIVVNVVDTPEALDGLMQVLAVSGWILLISGLTTVLLFGFQPGTRLQVLDTNMNGYGASLLVMVPGVVWKAMQWPGRQRTVKMWPSFIYLLLTIALVALSGSRGSALAVFALLLAFWLWKPTRPWGKASLLMLIVALICTPFVFSTVVRRFAEAESGVLGGRGAIWQAGWALIQEHLWGGVGIGNADRAVLPYLGALVDLHSRQQRSLHNPVLQIWAETGLWGLLLYLSVLGSAIGSFIRQYRRCREAGDLSLYPILRSYRAYSWASCFRGARAAEWSITPATFCCWRSCSSPHGWAWALWMLRREPGRRC